MAGRSAIMVSTWILGSPRRGQTWWPKRSNPITPSATIQLRLDSHSPRVLFCRSDTDMAPSSANTGHGTAYLVVDIKLSLCHSRMGDLRDCRWMFSPALY